MVQLSSQLWRAEKQPWFSGSAPDHLVHVYTHERVLVACLAEYVIAGLARAQACIVIASPQILISLQKNLRLSGVNVADALQSERYVTYDADEMIGQFMDGARVDTGRFHAFFRGLIKRHTHGAHVLRLYDEMVARLLDAQNIPAALEVERQWNGLLLEEPFSLYCAYPEDLIAEDSSRDIPRAIYGLHRSHLCY